MSVLQQLIGTRFSPADLAAVLALLFLAVLVVAVGASFFFRRSRRRKRTRQERDDAKKLSFLELATHQLGAPLASIRWWMEIYKNPDSTAAEKKEAFAQLTEATDRLDAIAKALTDAKLVDRGDVAYDQDVLYSLQYLVQKVATDAAPQLKKRKQTVNVSVAEGIEPVSLDSALFIGVLQELLDNAMHYSPDGSAITITVTGARDAALVAVADSGYGVSPRELAMVFQKFFRGADAHTYKPVGNGLGLFTAKGIIERCGGRMEIASKQGKGTTVSFTLPYERTVQPMDQETRDKKWRSMPFK